MVHISSLITVGRFYSPHFFILRNIFCFIKFPAGPNDPTQTMGHSASAPRERLKPEQVSLEFAHRCSKQFTAIEIYWFKNIFQRLADEESGIAYWKEDTLIRYLEIPEIDSGQLGKLIFKSASYLAGFPFVSTLSPALLTAENLIKVIALYDGRYKGLIKKHYDFLKLLFVSFATVENITKDVTDAKYIIKKSPQSESHSEVASLTLTSTTSDQQDVDDLERQAIQHVGEEDEEEEDLVLYTLEDLESWDEIDVVRKLDGVRTDHCFIVASDLATLFAFLLAIINLKPFQKLHWPVSNTKKEYTAQFIRSAWNLIRTIDSNVTESTKIYYPAFSAAVMSNFPKIFDPLGYLFDKLLFQQGTHLEDIHLPSSSTNTAVSPTSPTTDLSLDYHQIHHNILNAAMKSQLALIIGSQNVFGEKSLICLYSSAKDGFSMRAFQSKVFKWNAPTIILVQGHIMSEIPNSARERAFNEQIPPLKESHRHFKRATYGVYVEEPWKSSGKECFANINTILFQLTPKHDQYHASQEGPAHYAYFSKEGGIGFGSPPPFSGHNIKYKLGPVSLTLNESLEYGVFRHLGPGGSFNKSQVSEQAYEDRFVIDELEVWGCGSEEDLEEQRSKWEWEEKEAQKRRYLSNNFEEDRAILELAGLVGNQNASGGSV